MARHYKNFLRILEKWPVDKTKGERDFGLLLRSRVKEAFPLGETSQIDEQACERTHQVLRRLVDNHHLKTNPRKLESSATGLSAEECQGLLSTEFLEAAVEEDKGIFSRLFNRNKKE